MLGIFLGANQEAFSSHLPLQSPGSPLPMFETTLLWATEKHWQNQQPGELLHPFREQLNSLVQGKHNSHNYTLNQTRGPARLVFIRSDWQQSHTSLSAREPLAGCWGFLLAKHVPLPVYCPKPHAGWLVCHATVLHCRLPLLIFNKGTWSACVECFIYMN